MEKTLVAAASLFSVACETCGFYVRYALAAAKILYVVKKRSLLLRRRPSGHCEIVWVLSDNLAAASPAGRLAGFSMHAIFNTKSRSRDVPSLPQKLRF